MEKHMVAVVGAGPAGLFASRYLASNGIRVALFNRDIKPGGLAEYGIYPDKIKMKTGLRKQFSQIMELPNIEYFGNVKVSSGGPMFLSDLIKLGFQSILVTTGAQGTKWLNLPGEYLPGVYHAKDVVFHYNLLPPYSDRRYLIGPKVALVGAGNVMMDIARYLIRDKKVEKVTVVVRRGPGEIKFTRQELENVVTNLDFEKLDAEINRVAPIINAVGQDVEEARQSFKDGLAKALEPVSSTILEFNFLSSPTRIIGDWTKGSTALEVEDNTLVAVDGRIKPKSLGTKRLIPADTVIFAIGDTIDKEFPLPIEWDSYAANPDPSYPIEGVSYEAFDPDTKTAIKSVFLAGWARLASTGLVGVARKDGENAARAILQYLETVPVIENLEEKYGDFRKWVNDNLHQVITKEDLLKIESVEQEKQRSLDLKDFKFETNDEMLIIAGK
ncbi:MAG TPA: FAD-dependent oxidoreductase [Anaerolineales bacterium]|nr:FAD-dependent oxidoreductase [Anaerolineales bacterium]